MSWVQRHERMKGRTQGRRCSVNSRGLYLIRSAKRQVDGKDKTQLSTWLLQVFWKYQKESLNGFGFEGLQDIHKELALYHTSKYTRPMFEVTKDTLLLLGIDGGNRRDHKSIEALRFGTGDAVAALHLVPSVTKSWWLLFYALPHTLPHKISDNTANYNLSF